MEASSCSHNYMLSCRKYVNNLQLFFVVTVVVTSCHVSIALRCTSVLLMVIGSFVLEQAVGPGVLQNFSTCAVKQ